MSWGTTIIGTPEKLNAKLDEYGGTLTGQSKVEFDEAKPHIQAIVGLNVNNASQLIKLTANGHATFENNVKKFGSCSVVVETIHATLAM